MSRSLAWIGILTIAVAGITWKAVADQDAAETTSGVVITNHLPDAERDRLMNEAMEEARKKLEAESGKKPDETYTEKKYNEETEKRKKAADETAKKAEEARKEVARKQAEEEKKKAEEAAAKRKADEERLAKELAEAEKKASEAKSSETKKDDAEVKNLDTAEKSEESSKTSENSTAKKSDAASKSEPAKKTETAKKSEEPSKAKSDKPEPKTAVATVATNQPGARLTVKTTMPVGDDERRKEMSEAQRSESSESRGSRGSSDEVSLEGQVVGMAPGPRPDRPNLIVTTEDRRTVQIELTDSEMAIPGPGAIVTVRGRNVPGPGGQPVVRARSITMKNERPEPRRQEPVPPHVAGVGAPMPPGAGPMMPPPGMFPPPMPMPPVMPGPPFGPPPF